MTENTCCGIPEKLTKDFEQSIYRPILWKPEGPGLELGPWSIRLYKATPAGNVSKKGATSMLMNFCPFCGEALTDMGRKIEAEGLSKKEDSNDDN